MGLDKDRLVIDASNFYDIGLLLNFNIKNIKVKGISRAEENPFFDGILWLPESKYNQIIKFLKPKRKKNAIPKQRPKVKISTASKRR